MENALLKKGREGLVLESIYICESNFELCNNFDPLVPDQHLNALFKIEMHSAEVKTLNYDNGGSSKHVRYQVKAVMRYLKGPLSPEERPNLDEEKMLDLLASEINATFLIQYKMNEGTDLPKDVINEFGRINAVYHAWPYWREFCQTTCSRMSLPVAIAPMLIIE